MRKINYADIKGLVTCVLSITTRVLELLFQSHGTDSRVHEIHELNKLKLNYNERAREILNHILIMPVEYHTIVSCSPNTQKTGAYENLLLLAHY